MFFFRFLFDISQSGRREGRARERRRERRRRRERGRRSERRRRGERRRGGGGGRMARGNEGKESDLKRIYVFWRKKGSVFIYNLYQ